MAFGYEYWMVYLPALNPESFLLFVHNPAGSTKLRDYSGGREKVLGQPALSAVSRATFGDKTRFRVDAHTVSGEDGSRYWQMRTLEFNARYLGAARCSAVSDLEIQPQAPGGFEGRNVVHGRASRGSQRQLQDYVNEHEAVLTRALIEALPSRFQELGAAIQWVSPLARHDYAEYRDMDFLRAVGLGEFARELAAFWPSGGPSWDALGIVSVPDGKTVPSILLVEAKSHIPEVNGSGCQASPHSRALIDKSLAAAKQWCGARTDADWTGPLYQSANRLAHLYFFRNCLKRPTWLVNLYFSDDPFRPTGRDAWETELRKVKDSLGLTKDVPGVIELFLPALGAEDSTSKNPAIVEKRPLPVQVSTDISRDCFAAWRDRWTALAEYDGATVPDYLNRIKQIVRLWKEPIPGEWQRGVDLQLIESRYRRGNLHTARRGEHAIEYEILCAHFESVSCCGATLVDGINAFPLSRDTAGGGRRANVEADMLLLGERNGAYRFYLCEVKDKSNDPWYATIESLRQLRLFLSSPESQSVFSHRGTVQGLPSEISVTALILAPAEYYSSPGKKANAVRPALELIARCASEFGVDIRLAVWDARRLKIQDMFAAGR
jgi:hypothetical protein